jgi:hypothetical protein
MLDISTLHGHLRKSFGENQSLYSCLELQELHLVKNLTPTQASPVRKKVRAQVKTKVAKCNVKVMACLYFIEPCYYKIG